MTNEKFLNYSRYAFVAAISAIGGLVFALFLEVGYPARTAAQPDWCHSIGWLCHIYEWQTLVAGTIAVLVAFFTLRQIRREAQIAAWLKFREHMVDYAIAISHREKYRAILNDIQRMKDEVEQNGEANSVVPIADCPHIMLHELAKPSVHFNAIYFNVYLDTVKRCERFNQTCIDLAEQGRLTYGMTLELVAPLEAELEQLKEMMMHTVAEGAVEISSWNQMVPAHFRVTLKDELAPNGIWK